MSRGRIQTTINQLKLLKLSGYKKWTKWDDNLIAYWEKQLKKEIKKQNKKYAKSKSNLSIRGIRNILRDIV